MAKKNIDVSAKPDQTGHWEKKYDPCVYKDSRTTMGEAFSPKRSRDRMTTYNKVNESDH